MQKKIKSESLVVSTVKTILIVSFIIFFAVLFGAAGYLIKNKPLKDMSLDIKSNKNDIFLYPEEIDISKFMHIPEVYKEKSAFNDYRNVRDGYIVADKKIADVDGDSENEIVAVIETKIGQPWNQRLAVLDKEENTYREKFNADFNNLEQVYNNDGLLQPKLEIKDIDNDGINDVLYLQGDEEKWFTILNVYKFVGWDKGGLDLVLKKLGMGMNIDDFKDLDNDSMPELKIYNNIFKSNLGVYLEAEHQVERFNWGSESYGLIDENNRIYPPEIRMSVARWPDIYKWDGDKYYLANDKFPDEYMDFIKNTQKILENSDSWNGYFENYRKKAFDYQKSIVIEAKAGDGITSMSRKAIDKFLDKFYSFDYLDKMQKLYTEDYLRLKIEKKFNKLWPGDKIEFSLNSIDEAVLKARKLFPFFSCGVSMVKDIDGNIYNTVQIDSQCWMKENIKVSKNPKGDKIKYYCYDDFAKYCDIDGGLYDWNTAMNGSTVEGSQGICPNGWHIPKDSEWHILENYLTDPGETCDGNMNNSWNECAGAGSKLKQGGASGFDAILTGHRDMDSSGKSYSRGGSGLYWSSTQDGSSVWCRDLNKDEFTINRSLIDKLSGFPIRCIKD